MPTLTLVQLPKAESLSGSGDGQTMLPSRMRTANLLDSGSSLTLAVQELT